MALANPRRIKVTGADGKKVNLATQPLVAFALSCNHLGRDYAVQKGDWVFCPDCGTGRRVTRIIAE